MSYLGIDIGTTGCKAVAFDGEGHALCQAYREYATLSPQQVMAACRQTIAEALGKVDVSKLDNLSWQKAIRMGLKRT